MTDLFLQVKFFENFIKEKEKVLQSKTNALFLEAFKEHQKEIEELYAKDEKSFSEINDIATQKLQILTSNILNNLSSQKKEIVILKNKLNNLKKLISKFSQISITDFIEFIKIFKPNIHVITNNDSIYLSLENEETIELSSNIFLLNNDLTLNNILLTLGINDYSLIASYINKRFTDENINIVDFYYKSQDQKYQK